MVPVDFTVASVVALLSSFFSRVSTAPSAEYQQRGIRNLETVRIFESQVVRNDVVGVAMETIERKRQQSISIWIKYVASVYGVLSAQKEKNQAPGAQWPFYVSWIF